MPRNPGPNAQRLMPQHSYIHDVEPRSMFAFSSRTRNRDLVINIPSTIVDSQRNPDIMSFSSPSPTSTASLHSPTSSVASETHFLSLPPRRKQRVSAEHTLNRVRENQRRHRARRKDYITSLEEKLAETEKHLAEARAEIELLRRERGMGKEHEECVRPVFCDHEDASGNGDKAEGEVVERREGRKESPTKGGAAEVGRMEAATMSQLATAGAGIPPEMVTFLGDLSTFMADNLPSPIPTTTMPAGPPPCCEDIPAPSSTTAPPSEPVSVSPECSSCHERPAPLPTESTTLCAQAYVMIQQQNFRGIDAGTIRLWLYQGYRRAQREGEGCRVENGALFRLLDYISGI
ncbi:hypothetical protein P280DRAFT_546079 [Massarina eburnea CBS 473.64]|uniref:BZIP domain-containing protein n=1 Tax=Massarina eburnea CBS 473.64 TaxID=1395130 RepID=A0A6A6SAQ4_9PLEO|nr:hypothetical protein P280DRAFT_546079 [Massarina eburnea CBS 473.64]